ncbi:MAG: hypothetical protein A2042_07340 [Candidatus Schekmanbacteria bacterium GWA2_38_11]|uniref:Cyclophilin TM1367-like domain-containing protein n=1 Tax=Candidatus Schekmanbacteria bacterium GWA2_38_11 TaxID=1817876 RepID=A0A1F7RCK4_9BACT|nr:MAG: hypothetical protein A2042_07340 [Candidatus Schekmanbacteria bacterium GWA2_38_11]
MAKIIKIKTSGIVVEAKLNDSRTSKLIWEALPIIAKVETWGDEIYFTIPVISDLDETAKEFVEEGDLGYWPIGKAFCIFFGPTPITKGNKIKPASSVNIIGKVKRDPKVFKKAKDGDEIRIERED